MHQVLYESIMPLRNVLCQTADCDRHLHVPFPVAEADENEVLPVEPDAEPRFRWLAVVVLQARESFIDLIDDFLTGGRIFFRADPSGRAFWILVLDDDAGIDRIDATLRHPDHDRNFNRCGDRECSVRRYCLDRFPRIDSKHVYTNAFGRNDEKMKRGNGDCCQELAPAFHQPSAPLKRRRYCVYPLRSVGAITTENRTGMTAGGCVA